MLVPDDSCDCFTDAFVYHEGCFCDFPDGAGVRVAMRGGQVESAFQVSRGLPVPTSYARTIDELFYRVLAIAQEDPDEFAIHYDPTHHFIDKLQVNESTSAEDDAYSLEVRCFSLDPEACPITTVSESKCIAMNGVVTPLSSERAQLTCLAAYPGAVGQIAEQPNSVCCVKQF